MIELDSLFPFVDASILLVISSAYDLRENMHDLFPPHLVKMIFVSWHAEVIGDRCIAYDWDELLQDYNVAMESIQTCSSHNFARKK